MAIPWKRVATICAIAIVVLAALAAAGLHFATKALKAQVLQALGPESEVGEIVLGFSSIEVRQVRVHAPKGWPTEDTLRATRIVVIPDLRALLSKQVKVNNITVEDAYLSILRTREGHLRLLPSMLEKPAESGEKSPAQAVDIGKIEIKGGVLELFDATVRQPPHKVRLEDLHAEVEDLHLPEMNSHTEIDLHGVVKGVRQNGTLAVKGWIELASKDSELTTKLRGVDLVAFQPYLIKAAETGVKHGTLDFDLKSTVSKKRLHAPGSMTLSNLELASTSNSFMGLPRQAMVGAMKDRNGNIPVKFTLEGNLDDPKFSLNEALAMRAGSSIAGLLGVSVEGLAKGVGGAAQGVGSALSKMFGK